MVQAEIMQYLSKYKRGRTLKQILKEMDFTDTCIYRGLNKLGVYKFVKFDGKRYMVKQ